MNHLISTFKRWTKKWGYSPILRLISLISIIVVLLNLAGRSASGEFVVDLERSTLPANGLSQTNIRIGSDRGDLPRNLQVRLIEGSGYVERIGSEDSAVVARFRTSVLPGRVGLEISAPSYISRRTTFETELDSSDHFHDGTPDFLRLSPDDENTFRSWFTFLAEAQFYRPADRLPTEIRDCAALLRFAYRESLRRHDAEWLANLDLNLVGMFPAVGKYAYPDTPLRTALFRIRPGRFQRTDLTDGTFAQFADAQTLQRHNTHIVSRQIQAALPGDLLFYRQLDQTLPSHAMIVVGKSHFESDTETRIVYHTGPIGAVTGEIRRPTVAELLRHPEAKWRPHESNSNFLGVFRWNILR